MEFPQTVSLAAKANVLLVGGGAVGTIAAVNIEAGGLGAVTLVARSNYERVKDFGYEIASVDHGKLHGWRPTNVTNKVPIVSETSLEPFDFVICATKNCPDIRPNLPEVIGPAVTSKTVIVLIQNGLNIEKPFFEAFPHNVVLSGVSMIDSHETEAAHILHEYEDELIVGPFQNPNCNPESEKTIAEHFIRMYKAAGKTKCSYYGDVSLTRWKKLVFNACLNPICAITGLDDARVRLADGAIEGLVRPLMVEIVATANALGHELPQDIIDKVINLDPMDLYLKPSMQCDIEKGNFIEFENIIGEPLREAQRIGVRTPIMKTIYELCKMLQWRTKESKGFVTVPPRRVL